MNFLFAGDTLFHRSIEEPTFGEAPQHIIQSIRRKLLVLDERTIVYPGHGPATAIEEEKRLNPFLRT
jgi:glyoxylase-like metal-dependent hydrolase (beta-lactamase superfamily II)